MDMNPEVEYYIGRNVSWLKLPIKIKEIFGNAQKGYEKAVVSYSIRNQLRFSDNLIKHIRKDEPKYYEEVIAYSKDKLMLYPYHLSDRIVKGLRITPFQYYTSVMEKIMEQEKSYDSLPNFTAADCLRLLGIGRNQYIELMNQHRSSRKLFRRKPPRELLPAKPIDIAIDPWFVAHHGYVTEEDVVACKPNERKIIDFLIDNGGQGVGSLDYECIHSLYRKGLIYIDVPIESDDYIVVPPLEGFVMNRVLGDYFETLLYKIFVSIDEHTSVGELAKVLDIDAQLIKNAVSLYCRLGFAYKKNLEIDFNTLDASWRKYQNNINSKNRASYIAPEESLIADELKSALSAESDSSSSEINALPTSRTTEFHSNTNTTSDHSLFYGTHSGSFIGSSKRIAFLYDSTLTAFLMMGNLSPGLKNHAVTMFEVGKMADESLDSFLSELENVSWNEGEGEAQRYFEHAKTLRKTILFLRNNPAMESMSIDLLRCESLLNLDSHTCSRLLNKNYELLVSMAPLSYEVKAVCCESLPHFGPAIPQVNSIWFKLFLYSITNSGPTSLLLSKGTLLNELPSELEDCEKYLVTSWGHDSGIIPGANALFTVNEALSHSAVLVQAYGSTGESSTVIVPFPFGSSRNSRCSTDGTGDDSTNAFKSSTSSQIYTKWAKHPAIIRLSRVIDLEKNCGYITMMNIRGSSSAVDSHSNQNVHKAQANLPLSNMSNKLTNVTEDVVRESQSETDGELIMDDDEEEDHVYVSGHINPEPRNGFKDDQCAKLYQEELDNELILSSSQEELSTVKVKPKAFDSRQQKIESLRLDLNLSEADTSNRSSMSSSVADTPKSINRKMKSEDKVWFDDWTLLDCQFGIPLFDCGVNQIVCERMLSNGLWQEKSLEYLVKSNNELGKQLAGFINSYQAPNIWNEEIPLPSKNFYCHNGRLQEFEP